MAFSFFFFFLDRLHPIRHDWQCCRSKEETYVPIDANLKEDAHHQSHQPQGSGVIWYPLNVSPARVHTRVIVMTNLKTTWMKRCCWLEGRDQVAHATVLMGKANTSLPSTCRRRPMSTWSWDYFVQATILKYKPTSPLSSTWRRRLMSTAHMRRLWINLKEKSRLSWTWGRRIPHQLEAEGHVDLNEASSICRA